MKANSSASRASLFPMDKEKQPLTKSLQVRKIPPQPEEPGAPCAAPSVFTLIQPEGGGIQRTGHQHRHYKKSTLFSSSTNALGL